MVKEVNFSRSSSDVHARTLREVQALKGDLAGVDAAAAGLAQHIGGARVAAAEWVGRE